MTNKHKDTCSRQRKFDTFVRNEVIMLASQLVEDMIEVSMYGKPLGGTELDNIENLYITDETTAQAYGYDSLEAMQKAGEDRQEVHEWWFVTEWFYQRLRKKGVPVIDSVYGFIWGRTTTGQSLALDAVVQEIYDEL